MSADIFSPAQLSWVYSTMILDAEAPSSQYTVKNPEQTYTEIWTLKYVINKL